MAEKIDFLVPTIGDPDTQLSDLTKPIKNSTHSKPIFLSSEHTRLMPNYKLKSL